MPVTGAIMFGVCFYFAGDIIQFLTVPLIHALPDQSKLITTDLAGTFFTLTKVALLTADGKLRPCLGRHGEIDLLGRMRDGEDPADGLRAAIDNKPEDHEFLESYQPDRPMTAIGG